MRKMTRREMCAGLSAVAATGGFGQVPAAPAGADVLSQTKVYSLNQMPSRKTANGGLSRDVLRGALTTGEVIAVHESEQPAGVAPNPPHTIQHTEVIVVLEGLVDFFHDGKTDKAGPGGVIFVSPGTLHGLRNAGDGPAKYCVVQIGGDVKK